ncbi:19999_t:CDS:2, partial [Funneliformis geosporum]
QMTGKFEIKEEILKWKYRRKIGENSENNFKIKGKKKDTDEEGTIWDRFLKLPGCVSIDCGLDTKADMPYDEIEVTSIAHVSLFDSHYHANEMKVRNLLNTYAFKRDMGIESRRPVTGLNFASLYPSLIMAYNLSPDKIILIHEEADIAEKNGTILYKIEFPFNYHTVQA